jgi:hypothetical protein
MDDGLLPACLIRVLRIVVLGRGYMVSLSAMQLVSVGWMKLAGSILPGKSRDDDRTRNSATRRVEPLLVPTV